MSCNNKTHSKTLIVVLTTLLSFLGHLEATAEELPPYGWVQHELLFQNFTPLPLASDMAFGSSVAMDNGWLAVGAADALVDHGSYGTMQHGAVFLFHLENGTWDFKETITPYGYGNSHCGASVALDFPLLVVGCPGADNESPSTGAGKVYWYRYNFFSTPNWAFEYSWNEVNGSHCGIDVSVAVDFGGHVALAYGCPDYDDALGYVRVWGSTLSSGSWTQDATLYPTVDMPTQAFGQSLFMVDSAALVSNCFKLAVGAPLTEVDGSNHVGKAYVFESCGSSWTETDNMEPNFTEPNAFFGYDISVTSFGNEILIGEIGSGCCGEVQHFSNGATGYIVDAFGQVQASENAGGQPPGPQSSMRFGYALAYSADGSQIAIGAPYTDAAIPYGDGTAVDTGFVSLRTQADAIGLDLMPEIGPYRRGDANFGTSLDFGDSHHLAVGADGYGYVSGNAEGAVFIYGSDRIFGANFD